MICAEYAGYYFRQLYARLAPTIRTVQRTPIEQALFGPGGLVLFPGIPLSVPLHPLSP